MKEKYIIVNTYSLTASSDKNGNTLLFDSRNAAHYYLTERSRFINIRNKIIVSIKIN